MPPKQDPESVFPKNCLGKERPLWYQLPPQKLRWQKALEENIGGILFDIHHSKILFDSPPRVVKIKTKVNKGDLKVSAQQRRQ